MKKVLVILVLSLGMWPAWVQSKPIPAEEKIMIEVVRSSVRYAAREALTNSVGDRSIGIAGVPLLSTQEAASILADFTFNTVAEIDYAYNENVKQKMNAKEMGKTVAILYAREKLISGTHYLLKKTGLSLPKWVKNSPTLTGALDIGEHIAANLVTASLVDSLSKQL